MVDVVTLGETLLAFRVAGPLAVGAEARFSFAGAESNVAVGLARLGHAVACAGAVGGDAMATTMVRALRGEGIDCSALRVDATRPSALIVFDSPLAERRRVTYLRDGSAGSALTPADADAVWALNPGVVHVTGVTCALGDGARETVEVVVGEARRRGVTVSFDLNYRASLWGRDEAAAVLGPLARQADILFGADDELRLALDDAAPTDDALRALGPAQVVLKRGADGAGLVTAEGRVDAPSVATAVVDPVGAGDAFAAGFLSAHLDGLVPVERLGRGNAVAAFALGNHGDWEGLPMRAELPLVGAGGDVVR